MALNLKMHLTHFLVHTSTARVEGDTDTYQELHTLRTFIEIHLLHSVWEIARKNSKQNAWQEFYKPENIRFTQIIIF